MINDKEMTKAMRHKRSAVIPLGKIDENDELSCAKRHWSLQTIRYAFGAHDKVHAVCTAGYDVRSTDSSGLPYQCIVLVAADPVIVGWVEQIFGLQCLWMDGWSADEFKAMTSSVEIETVERLDKMPYCVQSMGGAIMLSAECDRVWGYLSQCCCDKIPEDLKSFHTPKKSTEPSNPCNVVIDAENPCHVTIINDGNRTRPFFEKKFPLPIRHIDKAESNQCYAVDLLGFKWKLPTFSKLIVPLMIFIGIITLDVGAADVDLNQILRENAPTNCPVAGCAEVYRVKDGALVVSASVGGLTLDTPYEPGSVVAPFVLAAAIENGMAVTGATCMTYLTTRSEPGYYRLPGDGHHVWAKDMTVPDAVVKSANVVLAKLGADVGPARLLAMFNSVGLGAAGGCLPCLSAIDKATKCRLGIGQGLKVTSDELCRAYVVLANQGVNPWTSKRILDAKTAQSITEVLCRVVSREGTARRAAIEDMSVAGKTGTAERIIDGHYGTSQYNATFVGFAPAQNSKYVVIVVYQTQRGDRLYQGGGHSALAFSQIMRCLLVRKRSDADVISERAN